MARKTIMLGVRPVSDSVTHSGRWCPPVQRITRMRSFLHHILKRDSSEKTGFCYMACVCQRRQIHCIYRSRWLSVRGVLYKGIRLHGAADTYELLEQKITLQRSFNCSVQAVRCVNAMQMRFLSSCADITFCCP